MRKAWIGLGGNVGDVRKAMNAALDELDAGSGIRVAAVSRLYATRPWGLAEQPDFLNAAAELDVTVDPFELLEACRHAEHALKRVRTVRWGPRTIDLDILAMEGVEMHEQRLTIPHPRLGERAFALAPLADLAPDLRIGEATVSQMLGATGNDGVRPIAVAEEWRRGFGRKP